MKRLFVLSVDSLFYEDLEWVKECPNLSEILNRGSLIEKVQSVYPAMTYAAHATMLTGCYPDTHGIYHNEKVQVDNPFPDWHWRREELKVPTLIDAIKPLGHRFCVVNWPVTGADPAIDYNLPEIWSETPDGDCRPRFLTVGSPEMIPLYDKYRHLLRWKYQPELDEFGTACLQEVMEQYQPEVVLLHLSYVDHTRHSTGGFNDQVKAALHACDERFGRIAAVMKRLGIYDETNFVVIGDHGHLPVKQVFHPNILLREQGLIQLNEKGQVQSWKAYCRSAGLSCHVVLKDPEDAEVRSQVEKLIADCIADPKLGCEQVLTIEEAQREWHLDGPFHYVIEGRLGTSFGNSCKGELLQPTDNRDYKLSVSAHGHMPAKGPQPTFFAAGPQIQAGVVLPNARLIDEAPTWAAIVGAEMPQAQGRVIKEILVQ